METNTLLVVTAAFGGAFAGTLATQALAPAPALKQSFVAAEKIKPAFKVGLPDEKDAANDFTQVGTQFANHFYQTFNQPEQLMNLFSDQSMLTFEGEQFMGQGQINEKLSSFGKVAHTDLTLDIQPSANNGIVVFVSGSLSIDDGQPMMFTEVFHLQQGGAQGYFVLNDIFRLNLR